MGAAINNDDGARWSFPRRRTAPLDHRAQSKLMTPHLIDSPPWLKSAFRAAGDAPFLWRNPTWRGRAPGIDEIDEDPPRPKKPSFVCSNENSLSKTRAPKR
jgi:hypothetical protein